MSSAALIAPVASPTIEAMAQKAILWLIRCQVREAGYDQGGVRDAVDGTVVGDHYATTHLAWACALRFRDTNDPAMLASARAAIAFHLRTSGTEYPPGSWDYHWDFNNLAFVETYRLLEPALDPDHRRSWREGLGVWKTNAHWAVNWVTMRAAAHFARHDLFGRPDDLPAADAWLNFVLRAQKADGGIEDVVGKSLPSQYHAYTACLLHRLLGRHPGVENAVVQAARWLLAVTAPDGEGNALGRGQGQIFGYACAVYLFRAAVSLDPEFAAHYRWAQQAVLALLQTAQTGEGWWPLVVAPPADPPRAGWYDYHHQSVYNAFTALWLGLAARLPSPDGEARPLPPGVTWLRESGLLAVRRRRYFALFCAGREGAGYHTEAGITPHALYFGEQALMRRPLGPGPGKYGLGAARLGQEAHCLAPLWRKASEAWHAPCAAEGSLAQGSLPGRWRLDFTKDGAHWRREIIFGERFVEARDSLELPAAEAGESLEVRAANLAVSDAVPWEAGPGFLRDPAPLGPVFRVWGGQGLVRQPHLATAAGQTAVFASSGANGPESGWRLRQGPAPDARGPIPGIVCLSADPWSELWKRKQRLLWELSRLGRSPKTLYIEPAVTSSAIAEQPRLLLGPGGERHRRALSARCTDMGHGFRLATPCLPFPGQRTFPLLAQANRRLWLRQLRRLVDKLDFAHGYVLWLYHPAQLDVLDALGDRAELVVYDWTDDWVLALPPERSLEERARLEAQQQELLRRADVIFTVSKALFERAAPWCPSVHWLPNATDLDVFGPSAPDAPCPPPMSGKPRPWLVYLSQITERLDVPLLAAAARARPQWTFVLIGPTACRPDVLDPLRGLDNVVLAGPLPYAAAAAVTAKADVCLLPHVEDALTRTLDPIKLYDYLATGRPIVAADVAMHPDLRPFVRVASSLQDFIEAVEAALAEDPALAAGRIQAAAGHSWPVRASQAADVLESFFPEA